MAKRKRDDSADLAAQDSPNPKKTKKEPINSRRHGNSNHARKAVDSTLRPSPGATSIHSGNRGNASLAPPPGLSRGQRKRWRKQQSKRGHSGSVPNSDHGVVNGSSKSSKDIKHGPPVLPTAQSIAKPTLDRSTVKRFAMTYLMPRRKRNWTAETTDRGTVKRKEPHLRIESESGKFADHATAVDLSIVETQRSEIVVPTTEEQNPPASSSSSSSRSSESNLSLAEQRVEPESDYDAHDGKPQIANARKFNLQAQAITLNSNFGRYKLLTALSAPLPVFRRPSLANKPNSIPAHSTIPDVKASFKRFTAFVEGSDDESTDDESDDGDEGESQVGGEMLKFREEKASSRAEIHNIDNDIPTTGPTDDVLVQQVTNELPHENVVTKEEEERLPRFARSSSKPASVIAWPANVGIKRQISFFDREAEGAQAVSGTPVDAAVRRQHSLSALQQPDPFDVSDVDSQDVLKTMDEISNYVLGSTRPLPASKPTTYPGPENEDQEDEGLTLDSSDRRVTRSMSTPRNSRTQKAFPEDVQVPSITVYSSFHIPDEHTVDVFQDDVQYFQSVQDFKGDVGDNIDVAFHGPRSEKSDGMESSSSLSELSRSPSPPTELGIKATDLYSTKEEKEESTQDDDTGSPIETAPMQPAPKKRKMTGRTSNHFTSEKRTKRKRQPAKGHGDQTLPVKEENEDAAIEAQDGEPVSDVLTGRRQHKRLTRLSLKVENMDEDQAGVKAAQDALDTNLEPPRDEGILIEPPTRKSEAPLTRRKRKSTGRTSSYFTPPKSSSLELSIIDRVDLYNTTGKKKRVPAGTSTAPVPSIHSSRFGIIQEKLWQEPFWLLIAVTFLNKTTGRAAVPIFWALKERYPTPEALANAKQEDLHDMIYHLGLQRQRSKRLISLASAWVERPPEKGIRFRTLHYPVKGNGKTYKAVDAVEQDADHCEGALEIGHIPGCGPYAWDSWRIFCRDVLRGTADDYVGKHAGCEGFVPEWQKVLPLDKELRACLRWMWLREGWIWDHETGKKREATVEEMERAVLGEMEIQDPQERKFAAQAAGVELVQDATPAKNVDESLLGGLDIALEEVRAVEDEEQPMISGQVADLTDASDNIVVTPAQKPVRRSARFSTYCISY